MTSARRESLSIDQFFGRRPHGPTVWQERNDHDLDRDFIEDIPGYMHNAAIREALLGIEFGKGLSSRLMMEMCHEILMSRGWIEREEEAILAAWLDEIESLGVR